MGLFVATLVRDGQHLHSAPWLPIPIRVGRLRQSGNSQGRHRGRTHEGQRKGWQQAGEAVGISGFALVSSPDPPIGRGGVSRALQNRIIMVRARREAMRQRRRWGNGRGARSEDDASNVRSCRRSVGTSGRGRRRRLSHAGSEYVGNHHVDARVGATGRGATGGGGHPLGLLSLISCRFAHGFGSSRRRVSSSQVQWGGGSFRPVEF